MNIYLTSKSILIDGTIREFAGPRISAVSLAEAKIKCPRGYRIIGQLVEDMDIDQEIIFEDFIPN